MHLQFVPVAGCRIPYGTRAPLVALAERLPPPHLDVALVAAGDALLRRLNRQFRGLDRTTDVLSFRYDGDAAHEPWSRAQGGAPDAEIYLSLARAGVQARELGHSPAVEFVRLAVHGLHHLQGYDHSTPTQARWMRAAEDRSLRWLAARWPRIAARPLVQLAATATRGTS